jgi:hypothetical protein
MLLYIFHVYLNYRIKRRPYILDNIYPLGFCVGEKRRRRYPFAGRITQISVLAYGNTNHYIL